MKLFGSSDFWLRVAFASLAFGAGQLFGKFDASSPVSIAVSTALMFSITCAVSFILFRKESGS